MEPIDLGAAPVESGAPTAIAPIAIAYAEFGERFVRHAVTARRIEEAVAGIAGRGLTIGPFNVGPVGLAGFLAEGKVEAPEVVGRDTGIAFDVRIPVSLAVKLLVGGRRLRVETLVSIDLIFHARTADPLLIVIDIPRVRSADVHVRLRLRAQDSEVEWMLNPVTGLLQREVANRVNAMLGDRAIMRSRIYDVEAIVAGTRSEHRERTEFEWIDYEEFGRRFFRRLVTRERLLDVIGRMVDEPIEIGPTRMGPRDAAQVTVRGKVLPLQLGRRPEDPGTPDDAALLRFDLLVPVTLDITVDVLKSNHYRANLEIPLELTVHAAEPLHILVEVAGPDRGRIRMEYSAKGIRAATLGVLAGVKKQISAQVVREIRTMLADPAARSLDVAAQIDRRL